MNSEEYEAAYWQARDALYRRGKEVGMPAPGRDGLRECHVDGNPLTDRELFTEAWGSVLADDILCLTQRFTSTASIRVAYGEDRSSVK
jgi:hypothetical protein